MIAYLISKTGWSLEYIFNLPIPVLHDLVNAFTDLDRPAAGQKFSGGTVPTGKNSEKVTQSQLFVKKPN